VSLGQSGSNNALFNNPSNATNALGSGGNLPGSRAMRIESRKGILSRKSTVNKNSFYKQKLKETLPNNQYAPPINSGGIGGGMNPIGSGGVGRGASSYFNKANPTSGGSGAGLPQIGSTGNSYQQNINKNSAIGQNRAKGFTGNG